MSTKNIVLVEPQSDRVGHTQQFLKTLTSVLVKSGYVVSVVKIKQSISNTTEMPKFYGMFESLLLKNFCYKVIKMFKIPTVNTRVVFTSCDLRFVFLFILIRRPDLCYIFFLNNYNNVSVLKKTILKYVLSKTTNALVYSKKQREFLQSISPDVNIKIVPHYTLYDDNRKVSKTSRKYDLTFIGNDLKYKRFDLFCEFAKSINYETCQICVAGDISEDGKGLINRGWHVKFGYLDSLSYYETLKNSKFVFIGHDSSFSLKVSGIAFDAISFGCGIIASDIAPFRELKEMFPKQVQIFKQPSDLSESLISVSQVCSLHNRLDIEENKMIILNSLNEGL